MTRVKADELVLRTRLVKNRISDFHERFHFVSFQHSVHL
jgi:hypothetical protein